jgi:BTB And C-terminal Kelch
MIDTIRFESCREIMEVAHLHDDEDLLDSCYNFVKSNFEDLVLEPSFAALSTENPDLWESMFRYLRPERPYKRYIPKCHDSD